MKLAMMLGDGFETVEATAPIDVLRRGGIEVKLISVMPTLNVTSGQGISVVADAQVDDVDLMAFDAICVPGGEGGVENLKRCAKLSDALPGFMNDDTRLVASICAGPTILNDLDLLGGRTATCYPGCEVDFPEGVYPGQGVFTDGNLVTASGPAYAMPFGVEILRKLAGDATANQVAAGLLMAS